MQPEQPRYTFKNSECPITRQINRYRNSLPQVARSQGHFFFKEISQQIQEIAYVSFGYRVGVVPYQLHDLFAVIVNAIHCACEINLKIIIDGDQLWVTSTMGYPTEELNEMRFNIQEAHLNQSLMKTRSILEEFLIQCKNNQRRNDSEILQKVKNVIVKSIYAVFKNPDLDD